MVWPTAREDYEFERLDQRFIAGRGQDTCTDAKTFASRLQIKLGDPTLQDEVIAYVSKVHQNILFYVKYRKREERYYKLYFILTAMIAIVVGVIPISIPVLFIQLGYSEQVLPYAVIIPAQIAAFITGIVCLHKIVTLWMFRYNKVYLFWKTSAQLKALLYQLEDEWKGRVNGTTKDSADRKCFISRLKSDIKCAEEIVASEREAFFESYAKTSVDLQTLIKGASPVAVEVTSRFSEPMKEIVKDRN